MARIISDLLEFILIIVLFIRVFNLEKNVNIIVTSLVKLKKFVNEINREIGKRV
jgi:hypothetical protein